MLGIWKKEEKKQEQVMLWSGVGSLSKILYELQILYELLMCVCVCGLFPFLQYSNV